MARPAHQPSDITRAEVRAMLACGAQQDTICVYLGINPDTLRKYYKAEIEDAHAVTTAQIGNRVVKKALSDDQDALKAAMFYLERRAGWAQKTELDAKVGGAVTIKIVRQGEDDDAAG